MDLSGLEHRILGLASKSVLDVGAFMREWEYGSRRVLRAIRRLARKGLVATYYRVPSSRKEWNWFRSSRRERPGLFYPPLDFYRVVALGVVEKAYSDDARCFVNRYEGKSGKVTLYLLDIGCAIEK